MAQNTVYYWDGKEFHTPRKGYWDEEQFRPLAGKLTSGLHFYGGPDRGLYVMQSGEHEHTGDVYELVDGRAIYVTDFYYDDSYALPGFYVSKSGQLFNWGKRFFAVYIQDKWKRIQERLSPLGMLIFDTSEKVYFYYGSVIYSVDKYGNFDKRQITSPIETLSEQKRIHGALWGRDKMFILSYFSKQVYAYHLDTGEPVNTEPINSYLANRTVYDVFAANDGAVWLLISDPELRSSVFLRITPECDITTVKDTTKLGWNNMQCRQLPHSVLNASDGSIWFATRRKGIVRYNNGKMQFFDWQQGVSLNRCLYLLEGLQGQIYASSLDGIYVFHQGQHEKPSTWAHQWQEYRLASSHPVRDREGNIWMFLEGHPGQISRWDGYRWYHTKVPFDTSKAFSLITDDKGHILVSQRDSIGWYDISPSKVNQYENSKDILVAAVSRGAKRFYTDRSFQGCFVLAGGKIWFGYHNTSLISYFDGERWDDFTMRDNIYYLYESPKYGILFRTQGVKYYTYERGQITHVEIPKQVSTRWLLGPKSLQPFEQELLDNYPDEYIPVERAEDGKLYMLVRREENNTCSSPNSSYCRADPLYTHIKTVTPGLWGGYWSDYFSGPVYRFFGGRVLKCDFQNTPLLGNVHEISQVLEDRSHNLWIDAGWYTGARHVFMKRLSDFKLTSEHFPTEVKRSVTINTEALLAGQPQKKNVPKLKT